MQASFYLKNLEALMVSIHSRWESGDSRRWMLVIHTPVNFYYSQAEPLTYFFLSVSWCWSRQTGSSGNMGTGSRKDHHSSVLRRPDRARETGLGDWGEGVGLRCRELAAREERAAYYWGILFRVSAGEMDAVVGYDTQVLPLTPQPITRRMRTPTKPTRKLWNRPKKCGTNLNRNG